MIISIRPNLGRAQTPTYLPWRRKACATQHNTHTPAHTRLALAPRPPLCTLSSTLAGADRAAGLAPSPAPSAGPPRSRPAGRASHKAGTAATPAATPPTRRTPSA